MQVRTKEELAQACGVHPRTADNWIKAGAPKLPDGSFDVDVVAAWARERRSQSGKRHGEALMPNDSQRTGDERPRSGVSQVDRFRKLKADEIELKVKKARGLLIERAEVDRLLVARAITFKRELTNMARKLAPLLVGKTVIEIRAEIELQCRHLLDKYSREDDVPLLEAPDDEEPVDALEDGEDGAPPAGDADGLGMG